MPQDVVAAYHRDQRRRVQGAKVAENRAPDPNKINKPKCPIHKAHMSMNPELGMWTCAVKSCKLRAWPKDTPSKPVTGTGKLSCYRQNDRLYLRSENNVVMDITAYVIKADVEQSMGSTIVHLDMNVLLTK
jgi:hypothetical protein